MAALADLPGLAVRISAELKMLWHRAKDVPDVHALIATTKELNRAYIQETLSGILPDRDPRHAEIEDLLRRFGPGAL